MQDNAQRDELSRHNEFATKTIQTDYAKLMECMDEEKSFWWKLPKYEKSIASFQQLREWHESTYILNMESYNAQFCARLPALLKLEGGVEKLYFDLMEADIPEEIRKKHLAYIRVRLHNFALSDEAFAALAKKFEDYKKSGEEARALTAEVRKNGNTFIDKAKALITGLYSHFHHA